MEIKPKRVVLTGGHAATPALGTVEEIAKRNKDWQLYWVGPTSAMETSKTATAAEKTLNEYGVTIKKIVAGKALRRGNFITLLKAYVKIPFGFVHAFWQIFKIKPDITVSFGGFAALPVVFATWLLGKPIILQEQIVGAGLANKLSSPFAKKIAVARQESLELFPKQKTSLIGNPQISQFFQISKKTKIGNPVTIFITGGSSGAQIINATTNRLLETLLSEFVVIHQTGENNLKFFLDRKEDLPQNLKNKYIVVGYVNPKQFVQNFEQADIIVSRAGANTVSDIVASHTPAILIPLSWSIGDEQRKNAQRAQKTGLVKLIDQDDLTAEFLLESIKDIQNNWQTIVNTADTSEYDLDKFASAKLVDLIEGEL